MANQREASRRATNFHRANFHRANFSRTNLRSGNNADRRATPSKAVPTPIARTARTDRADARLPVRQQRQPSRRKAMHPMARPPSRAATRNRRDRRCRAAYPRQDLQLRRHRAALVGGHNTATRHPRSAPSKAIPSLRRVLRRPISNPPSAHSNPTSNLPSTRSSPTSNLPSARSSPTSNLPSARSSPTSNLPSARSRR
ncbi:pentapeptide repeat-containing protein [Novosphingobium nitrogenifigens]